MSDTRVEFNQLSELTISVMINFMDIELIMGGENWQKSTEFEI